MTTPRELYRRILDRNKRMRPTYVIQHADVVEMSQDLQMLMLIFVQKFNSIDDEIKDYGQFEKQ